MNVAQEILSDITVHMKYSKYLSEYKKRESWTELVDRNKQMHIKKYPELEAEIERAYELVYVKKVLPSMRSLQFGGKPIEISPNRVYNCAYLPIDDLHAFSETMFLLLGGTGVGFSVQTHHVEKLPEIRKPNPKKHKRFLVGDSIEGWSDAVKAIVKSYFRGGSTINFDFSDVRPKGAMLVTSGGKAPGPQPLKECLLKLEGILSQKQDGDKLSSIEVHDMVCHIADAVLAGGIRRAALISLFCADDEEMIACKSGNWWELNPQRGRANNSAVLLRNKITQEFFMDLWEKIKNSGSGEPGIYLSNDKDWGTNPCISGESLITVKDHNGISGGESLSEGLVYQIPMKMLVDLYETNDYPPMILTLNEDTKELEYDYMNWAKKTKENAELIELSLDNGKTIKLTPDHKVYTENRGWVEAAKLSEDDVLISI
jgi:ribonucleoside-diphosphate reductase alpha chain